MKDNSEIVLFICEHGSAKSTIAASHFNKLARERNMKCRAISRGTTPDDTFPANVTAGLLSDGLQPDEPKPVKLDDGDLAMAARIVIFSELPAECSGSLSVDDWSDVPPVSENYEIARDEIVRRVKLILDETDPAEGKEDSS